MLKKYSLTKQMSYTFLMVIVCTFISVIVSLLLIFQVAMLFFYPADYYDKRLSIWLEYADKNSNQLLEGRGVQEFEELIQSSEVNYQIINFLDDTMYGEQITDKLTKKQIIEKLNRREDTGFNNFLQYTPLFNDKDEMEGCLILAYPIRLTARGEGGYLVYGGLFLFSLLSPFLFLIIYARIFGAKLKQNIMEPLSQLTWATREIKENNLDFHLDYPYKNEFSQLIMSFELMRKTLGETLCQQWALEQQQKDLIAALAHDLRTPLTVMNGYLEMLQEREGVEPEHFVNYLGYLSAATKRATQLVEDLTVVSRTEKFDFQINRKRVSVGEYFVKQLIPYENFGRDRKIKLLVDISEEIINDFIEIDATQMARVLDNLMMNAFKFAPNLSTITVRVFVKYNKLFIEVIDEGEGFSSSDLKYGMNRFYRGQRERGKDGGMGLGLYISQKIINLHNGEMSLLNTKKGGALVIIMIPFY